MTSVTHLQTQVKTKTLAPEWNESFTWDLHSSGSDDSVVEVIVYDHDKGAFYGSSAEYLGSVSLSVSSLEAHAGNERWYPLIFDAKHHKKEELITGAILLKFDFVGSDVEAARAAAEAAALEAEEREREHARARESERAAAAVAVAVAAAAAAKPKVRILAFSPLAKGSLTGKYLSATNGEHTRTHAHTHTHDPRDSESVRSATILPRRASLKIDAREASIKRAIVYDTPSTAMTTQLTSGSTKDLRCTRLKGTNMTGYDLSHTDLRRADLRGCSLAGANLRGARLPAWDSGLLEGVNLVGAKGWLPADKVSVRVTGVSHSPEETSSVYVVVSNGSHSHTTRTQRAVPDPCWEDETAQFTVRDVMDVRAELDSTAGLLANCHLDVDANGKSYYRNTSRGTASMTPPTGTRTPKSTRYEMCPQ